MQATSTEGGIYIQFDQKELDEIEYKLGALKNRRNQIIARAVNRAISPARKIVKQETAKHYEINQKYIEEGDDGRKAFKHQRASATKPYAVLTYNSPYTNIYKWKGRRLTVTPQYAHVGSSPKPKFYKSHALRGAANEALNRGAQKPFVQTGTKKGKRALFVRTSKSRFPIMGLAGPAMSQGIKQPGVMDKIEAQTMATLEKRIKHEIDALLKGYTS